jgi:NADH:ubiquinone oxidoreductase subunit E
MEDIIARYTGQRSDVIQALQDTQKAYGYISPEQLQQISRELGSPYAYTYAIATFYKAFALQERGKYVIKVCDGTACHLKLSDDLLDELTTYLQVGVGEMTKDRLFTIEQVNCLGACALAPAMAVNEQLYGALTRKKVRQIIDELRKTSPVPVHKIVSTAISSSLEKMKTFIGKVAGKGQEGS